MSASLRVNNEKGRKGKLAFTTTRSHVRDPNRCTLSPRLRLGTATTRDNRRKRCANTEHCAVAARGFKFDLASRRVFVSFRHSSRLSLASPLFFSKSIRSNQMDRRVDNEKKKKKSRTRRRKDSRFILIFRRILTDRSRVRVRSTVQRGSIR